MKHETPRPVHCAAVPASRARRGFLRVWAVFGVTIASYVIAQPVRVAVLDFKNYSDNYESFLEGLPDLLSGKLAASGDAIVVERAQIYQVLQEQGLSRTSDFDPETAARVGRLLGVHVVVLGGLHGFGNEVELAARVVTVETGIVNSGYSARGSPGDMLDLVDKLAQKVRLAWSSALYIKSTPGGATVYLDSKEKGTSPVRLVGLKSGMYSIAVSLSGYQTYRTSISLARGEERTVTAELEKVYTPPPVTSTPAYTPPKKREMDPCLETGLKACGGLLILYLILYLVLPK